MPSKLKVKSPPAANTEPMAKAPPNRLRELRQAAGLSRAELAVKLGMSEGAVIRWELRMAGIPDKRKPTVARILGTTVEELMAGWPEADEY
jgi:transcriptional regulator with XRE-family HTH domain